MNNLLELQHNGIRSSFQQRIIVKEHRFNVKYYQKLQELVSRAEVAKISQEHQRIDTTGIDRFTCGCGIRRTLGLPYACQ